MKYCGGEIFEARGPWLKKDPSGPAGILAIRRACVSWVVGPWAAAAGGERGRRHAATAERP